MAGICRFDFLTTAGVKAKAEILPFGFMKIVVGIVVEIFGYPELLSISIDDAIDSLVLVLCDVFGLRGHRARPFVERGRFLYNQSIECASHKIALNRMNIGEKWILELINRHKKIGKILTKTGQEGRYLLMERW